MNRGKTTVKENVANNIKRLRKEAGLTQRDLSKKLEISASAIAQYESGKTFPRPEYLSQIATELNVNVMDLFSPWDEEEQESPEETITNAKEWDKMLRSVGYDSTERFQVTADSLLQHESVIRNLSKRMEELNEQERQISKDALGDLLDVFSVLNVRGQLGLVIYALELAKDKRYSTTEELLDRVRETIRKNKKEG